MQTCVTQVSIAASGAIPPLVKLLEAGTDAIKERAAWALSFLAESDENKVMASSVWYYVVLTSRLHTHLNLSHFMLHRCP